MLWLSLPQAKQETSAGFALVASLWRKVTSVLLVGFFISMTFLTSLSDVLVTKDGTSTVFAHWG